MKKLLFICTSLLAINATDSLKADQGFYAGLLGGANWANLSGHHGHHHDSDHHHKSYKNGYVVGGSVGYQWCQGFRLEGEIAYRKNDQRSHHKKHNHDSDSHHEHGRLSTWSYMANGIYEVPVDCYSLKPYVGFGLGYADQKIHNKKHHHKKNDHRKGFAYQVIAGIAYPICEEFDINLEYRFFRAKNSSNNNALVVGTKFMF